MITISTTIHETMAAAVQLRTEVHPKEATLLERSYEEAIKMALMQAVKGHANECGATFESNLRPMKQETDAPARTALTADLKFAQIANRLGKVMDLLMTADPTEILGLMEDELKRAVQNPNEDEALLAKNTAICARELLHAYNRIREQIDEPKTQAAIYRILAAQAEKKGQVE